jgi:hypothetical protein
MTTAWLLNTVGLLVTTIGALLIFLYLFKSPQLALDQLPEEGRRTYAKHRRLLIVAVGLLAAWLVVQYVGIIAV